MKNRIAILALLLAGGCTESPVDDVPAVSEKATVEIHVQPSDMEHLTRATDEAAITDLNFHLYGEDGTLAAGGYAASVSPLRFECPAGRFRLYLIANLHRELGRMEEAELKALRIERSESYETLPMSALAEIEIPQAGGVVSLPPIEVQRNVARIEYDIRIDEAVKGQIELEKVRCMNLPDYATPFSENPPRTFYQSEAVPVETGGHSGRFYMFPNEQGSVPSILTQQQRTVEFAPANATYLLIYARHNRNRVVNYVVYLGENNRDDFNVRRNNVQILSITIKGVNTVDTRVDSYLLLHAYTPDMIGGFCIPGSYEGSVMFRGSRADGTVTAHYEWLEGDESHAQFSADGAVGDTFPLRRNRQVYYRLAYTPDLITPANDRTRHRLTVTDDMDHVTTFDMPLQWANRITAHCYWGSVESPDALAQKKRTDAVNFACVEHCRLRAVPDSGYTFDGWYADARYQKLLSDAPEYAYTPVRASSELYARFKTRQVYIYTNIDTVDLACNNPYTIDRERRAFVVPYGSECTISGRPTSYITAWYDGYDLGTANWLGFGMPYSFTATEDCTIAPQHRKEHPLDTDGTANCYTVQGGATLHSFDATVQGNGRVTKNITPQKITGGVKAAVLWHTSNSSPAGQVAYRDGRIYFVAGSGGGANAVIGLLDADGKVLWSWHIWRTADPATTAETYPDGRTFMDRNLGSTGARTSNGEAVVEGYGFYYQWGRKDPFIYPKRYSEARPSTDAVYAEGFKPNQTIYTSATTTQWAAAHPTTFINGTETWTDWLPRHNINLWGNASTSIYYPGSRSEKTIYDPCPPGWKVPDETAWTDDAFYIDGFHGIGYMYLATSNLDKYYYPVGGYYLNGTFVGVNTQAVYWTDSPARTGSQSPVYLADASCVLIADRSGMKRSKSLRRDAAAMVRCMKDE